MTRPSTSATELPRHRVVIIGAGFGGLFGVRALGRAPLDGTVVDAKNHHLFQPLLYQVATGLLSVGDIAPVTRDVLRHHENTRVLLGEVVDIDLGARELHLDTSGQRSVVPYDSLIVAAGATHARWLDDRLPRARPPAANHYRATITRSARSDARRDDTMPLIPINPSGRAPRPTGRFARADTQTLQPHATDVQEPGR